MDNPNSVSLSNAWVESYLEALLSKGLSSEHVGARGAPAESSTQRATALDGEQSIAARYYVNQILNLDEDRIRDAWSKTSRPSRAGQVERDARLEQLSWRVWGMKRRRAHVQAQLDAERREAAADMLRVDEEKDEADLTALMTIDELNATTMEEYDEDEEGEAGFGGPATLPSKPVSVQVASGALKAGIAPGSAFATPFATGTPPGGGGLPSAFASPPGIPRIATGTGLNTLVSGTLTAPASPTAGALGMHASVQPPTATASVMGGATAPDPLLVSRFPRLYVILISLHGLVRGEKMELGKDPDTGGQVKYVVELAKTLGQFPSVARVDLLTRLIADPKVDKSYNEPEERLILPPLPPGAAAVASAYGGEPGFNDLLGGPNSPAPGTALHTPTSAAASAAAGSGVGSSPRGAFIVRLPCGPADTYLRKEDLWPHVREFSDRAIAHAQATLARLQESGEGPCELYVVHGHYADAGEVAAQVASGLGVDCVLTGHSLGRNKKEHLLKSGTMRQAEVEATYRISRRIEAEERALDTASVVFTSTQQEVAEQWGAYDGYSERLSAALALRPCRGYHMPRMAVIPPGLDFSNLKVSMPNDPWEEVLGSVPPVPLPAATPAGPGQTLASAGNSELVTAKLAALTPRHSGGGTTTAPANGSPKALEPAGVLAGDSPARKPPLGPGDAPLPDASPSTITIPPLDVSTGPVAFGSAPPLRVPGRPSQSNQLSRRQSHTGTAQPSVAATPRGPAPYVNPGSINPSKLAVMMVGDSEPPIWREINRFLKHPGRPVILAMCRPDAKKNVLGLVHAYGKSRILRELANLVLVLGNRDVIDGMAPGSARVLSDVLKLIDSYDLYGHVAYPKRHSQADISDIYLLAAATRGVFVNVALQEPFGLTLIEAAAHGAPIVATTHGGPVDIVSTLKNGVLVDPNNQKEIGDACVSLITSSRMWDECSESGRRNITAYSWPSHCARYLRMVQDQKAAQYAASKHRVGLMYGAPAGGEGAANKNNALPPAPRIRHTLSLSYDDLGSIALQIAGEAGSNNTGLGSAVASVSVSVSAADGNNGFATSASPRMVNGLGSKRVSVAGTTAAEGEKSEKAAAEADVACDVIEAGPAPSLTSLAFDPQAANVVASTTPAAAAASVPPAASTTTVATTKRDDAGELSSPTALESNTPTGINPSGAAAVLSSDASPATMKPSASKSSLTFTEGGPLTGRPPSDAISGSLVGSSLGGSMTMARTGITSLSFDGTQLSHMPERSAASASAGSLGMMGAPEQLPRILQHQSYVVFNLDSTSDVTYVAPLLRALLGNPSASDSSPAGNGGNASGGKVLPAGVAAALAARLTSDDSSVGVGVLCNWSNKQLRALLEREGVDPLSLDFTVCNAGSLIWQTMAQPANNGLTTVAGTSFLCDDDWEAHVDFRWDERVVAQVLRRIMDSRVGWGKLHVLPRRSTYADMIGPEATAAPAVPPGHTAINMAVSRQSTPQHMMMEVDIVGSTTSGKPPLTPTEVANQLLSSIRRKLRMSGVRAHVSVTPREALPESSGNVAEVKRRARRAGAFSSITSTLTSLAATLSAPFGGGDAAAAAAAAGADATSGLRLAVHITPLRCSRALAMRHLASRCRRPLSAWTLVTTAGVPATGAAGTVELLNTDGEDLLGGMQRVVLLPARPMTADGAGAPGLGMPQDVSVYLPAVLQQAGLELEAGAAGTDGGDGPRVTVVVPGSGVAAPPA